MIQPPDDGLTDKQRVFVEEYLACWNAAEAARRAGYRGKFVRQLGAENLEKPYIQAYIKARLAEKAMAADEVLARLADQARGSMDDFVTVTGRGFRIDIAKAKKAGKMHLIKSISRGKQGIKIEIYDAHAALVDIGRHEKLFTDNFDMTSGGKPLGDGIYERVMERIQNRLEIFPTRVGVNRQDQPPRRQVRHFPHTRGGEPDLTFLQWGQVLFSPHAWG